MWGRFTMQDAPKHGSWLNPAETELGLLPRQGLGSRRLPDLPTLRRECRAWNRRVNRQRLTMNWRFHRRIARRKFSCKGKVSKRSVNCKGHKRPVAMP